MSSLYNREALIKTHYKSKQMIGIWFLMVKQNLKEKPMVKSQGKLLRMIFHAIALDRLHFGLR